MGNGASKLKGNPTKGVQHAIPRRTLPPAHGARLAPEPPVPPVQASVAPAPTPAPLSAPHVRTAAPAPTVADYQSAEIIKDGLDPDLAAAPEPLYASHLANLGPVSVGKPRIRLARNDRMLAILARRKREAKLDPTERVGPAAEAETEDGVVDGPSVPLGSRSSRSTRLEVPVLLDLLSARTHATEPYHIDALAKEFGLDPHTLLALGRRFGAPREVERVVERVAPDGADANRPASHGAAQQSRPAETQTQTQTKKERSDLASTPIGGESAATQRFLVWTDAPEVKMPSS